MPATLQVKNDNMTPSDDAQIDHLLTAFSDAWSSGTPPDIRSFLPSPHETDSEVRRAALIKLVIVDLENRWRRAELASSDAPSQLPPRPTVEDYVAQYADLGPIEALPLEVICEEYRVRRVWGDRPSQDDYLNRFQSKSDSLLSALSQVETQKALDETVGCEPSPRQELSTHALTPSDDDSHRLLDETVGLHDIQQTFDWSSDGSSQSANIASTQRYEMFDEIARGGMGTVIRGRDNDLGREVAIKVMLEPDRASVAQRFIEEARIGGQLQHPGIVPVYELGKFSDNRPFFTMKLVRGETLHALLRARQDVAAERTKFIGIFEQMCQTLAYAHSQNVIHRDLKPSNVMVGAFGEVQVMDWGLAKFLAKRRNQEEVRSDVTAVPDQNDLRNERSDTSIASAAGTIDGAVMGTPPYMPPEQAKGEVDRLDERVDVFGLGAILCEILTGKPPYVEETVRLVHRMASEGDLADCHARLNSSGADRDLVDLAKSCLEPDVERRPRHAGEVAAKVTEYVESVESRLRQAEIDRVEASTRAMEERKRRQVTLALAASVLIGVTLVGAGSYFIQKQRTELAQERATAAEQKSEREAKEASERAQIARQVSQSILEARRLQSETHSNEQEKLLSLSRAVDAAKYAESLMQTAEVDRALREEVENVLSELDSEMQDRRLVAALDEAWRWDSQKLAEVGNSASVTWEGTTVMFPIPDAAPLYAGAFSDWGIHPDTTTVDEASERIRAADPEVISRIVVAIQRWKELLDESARTVWFDEVVQLADSDAWRAELREEIATGNTDSLANRAATGELTSQPAIIWVRLAVALRQNNAANDAIALLRRLHQRDAGDYWVNYVLAQSLAASDSMNEALRHATAAVAVRPDSAAAHLGFNAILGAGHGRFSRDDPLVTVAVSHAEQATELDPGNAIAHFYLANAYKEQGRFEEAVSEFRRAITCDPTVAQFHNGLALVLTELKEYKEAEELFHETYRLDPTYEGALNNLGILFRNQERLPEAIEAFRAAIELNPEFARYHTNLGMVLGTSGNAEESVRECMRATTLDPTDVAAHYYLGTVLARLGRLEEGIAMLRKAEQLDPNLDAIHNNLGNALAQFGNIDGAIKHWEQSLKLNPDNPSATNNLGNALFLQGRVDEAEQVFRDTIATAPTSTAHGNLGAILNAQGKLKESIVEYRKSIQLDPKNAESHANLAHNLQANGDFEAAAKSFRLAHEIGSQSPFWRNPSAEWIRQIDRIIQLEKQLPAVLDGTSSPEPGERAEYANICYWKRQYRDAVTLYASAMDESEELANDLSLQHRYNAACSAGLAITTRGEGNDLTDEEVVELRKQAIGWLRDDLAIWRQHAENPQAAAQVLATMQHWQNDTDLTPFRSPEIVETLPAEEQTEITDLWQDVADVIRTLSVTQR